MSFVKEKIHNLCEMLKAQSVVSSVPLDLEYQPTEYKTGNTPPAEGWMPYNGAYISGRDAHYWFRSSFSVPKAAANRYYMLNALTGKEGDWDATNPQGLLYLNGEMVQGLDVNHTEAYIDDGKDHIMHNYFYMGMIHDEIKLRMNLIEIDERIEQLYYDIRVPLDCCLLQHPGSEEYCAVMDVLEQAANLVDMRKIYSEAYYESLAAAKRFLETELYEKLCSTEGKPVVNCIGHTHIDVEWLWDRRQTREKIQRSFSTVSALMKRYPEYRFMLSQPELYRYLKEEAPEKYAELQQLVKEGRWEPEGSMWVECDTNITGGESFIRQILQGKKFFKDEFGKENEIFFLPDVFGYSACLPQILKKCGIRYFVTSKISWNETNTFPHDSFVWEGIDGSEVFAYFITAQDYAPDRNGNPPCITNYVGNLSPSHIKGARHRFIDKSYSKQALTTFGFGDGGGGPTKHMLENQRRLAKGIPGMPVTRQAFLLPYLDSVKEEFEETCRRLKKTPRWVGEMYLELHRGTYTSQAKVKKGNRRSELMLGKAEALSYTDLLQGGSYDADGLYRTWNTVLHDQFHDILPGSSIHEVYEHTDKDYAAVAAYCGGVIDDKLNALSKNIQTDGGLLVYNALGFAADGIVTADGKTAEIREAVPAYGWAVLSSADTACSVKVDGLTAENPHYVLTLDKAGRIVSLFDKKADRQVLKEGAFGNELQVFEDIPRQYDAWEITDFYRQKMWALDTEAQILPITDGSRAGFRISRRYLDSSITQKVWLYSHSRRIDFETEIDWHQKHQLVKAAFPLDIHTQTATYDIQFGHFERPTHQNTSWEAAKFEVPAHKWVDLSESGYGVGLLNDCKYGHSTEGSTLKITLLKCAADPDPFADEGLHTFTYSLLPHEGDLRSAGVIREAYKLNQPLTALPLSRQEGTLSDRFSLISCDKENVVIETVKKAEADDSMIVRLYDSYNCKSKVTLTAAAGFKSVKLCDMLENELEELSFSNDRVTVPVSNFEIVTLKFSK